MTARLTIEFEPQEGAVTRLVGLIERRGFRVCGLAMDAGRAGSITIDVEMRDSGRRMDVLRLQIARLLEVSSVSSSTSASGTIQ